MANHSAFTPAGEVVLTAARLAQDPGGRVLTVPFYNAAVRDAIQELCYDTAWDNRSMEVDIPEDRTIRLPDISGLGNIYVFNGSQCDVTVSTPVFIKRNYVHKGGEGFFAQQKGINVDPMIQNTFRFWEPGDMYYGGVHMDENGTLYLQLSEQCKEQFKKVRVEYFSLGQKDRCDVPKVPTWAKQAVTYWVAHRACEARLGEGNAFVRLERLYAAQLEDPMKAWMTAKVRYKRMDKKQRDDSNFYNFYYGKGRW